MALCRGVLVKVDRKEILEKIVEKVAIVAIDQVDNPEKLRAALEQAASVFNAAVEWIIKGLKIIAINGFIKSLNSCIDADKISSLIRQTALDIEGSNGVVSSEKVGIDILSIMEYLIGLSSVVLTGIAIFAAAELLWYAASEGISAIVSEIVAGMLKNVVLSLLLTSITVETLNEVGEKTSHGISNSVIQALLKMFSISTAFAGMIWDLYNVLVEKAKEGSFKFYLGLSMAIISFAISVTSTNSQVTGELLKYYDFVIVGVGLGGLFLMYKDRAEDIGRALPLTSLLEWCVGWASVISSFIKLSADAATGFKG